MWTIDSTFDPHKNTLLGERWLSVTKPRIDNWSKNYFRLKNMLHFSVCSKQSITSVKCIFLTLTSPVIYPLSFIEQTSIWLLCLLLFFIFFVGQEGNYPQLITLLASIEMKEWRWWKWTSQPELSTKLFKTHKRWQTATN